ncbi:MAG TPA: putative nucleotidyltransferase substrate binding domain-containing protein [Actinomycetota bacterium]|nr:putative nucleotidyltransferase substrate binding domain-containing protein [Actinomycetota bacterium]
MDVSAFLARTPPFDTLDGSTLARLVRSVQIEHFPPGAPMVPPGAEAPRFLYLIRKGAVEVIDGDTPLDLMTEGEAFGAGSPLDQLGETVRLRAHEDTLCYLIPSEIAEEVLHTRRGMAFVMGTVRRTIARLREERVTDRPVEMYRPVGSLIRRPPVTCGAGTSVAEAARLMARERISCVLVAGGEGWGILTDRDLRSRVVAEGRDPERITVSEVMTPAATTVEPSELAGEVLLRMLEHGFHHCPVRAGDGRLLGVVTDTDLMGLGRETPFALKSAIERAPDAEAAVREVRRLPQVISALVEAGSDPVETGHVVAFAIDALTRRLLDLGIDRLGEPPVPWAWLALGGAARQEQALRTDQDHALVVGAGSEEPEEPVDAYFAELATLVTDGLETADIPRCEGHAMATNRVLRTSIGGWERRLHGWMEDPSLMGSVFLSIAFDRRQVAGPLDAEPILGAMMHQASAYPLFLRHLARRGLDLRPPTGFFRDVVVGSQSERAGRLDLKQGGITIVNNLARYWAIRAGVPARRTVERLRATGGRGGGHEDLVEAFRFLWQVRLRHQVEQVGRGTDPDDLVDPRELGPVVRQGLKEAFRTIGRAQRVLALELGVPRR